MSAKILRYEVPVDDQWHTVKLPRGPIVHVASRNPDRVEFWQIDRGDGYTFDRTFRVFGTGQPLPDEAGEHIGTAIIPGGQLVWHLMEHR